VAFAAKTFEPEAADLFFQLVSAWYERASLIVTSNKPFGKAHMFAATYARRHRNCKHSHFALVQSYALHEIK
jgi:DNA replication protein DnaC